MHSIIIPHKNRNRYLCQCLRSIEYSRQVTRISDFEVVVVDNLSQIRPYATGRTRVVSCWDRSPVFNKPKCLNLGIEAARGDVLTFLDADAIVGPLFLENYRTLFYNRRLTRLCYRVRRLPNWKLDGFEMRRHIGRRIWHLFAQYEDYPRAYEAYELPELNGLGGLVFGNSQWSIRRDRLGDLRFNEEFAGRGFEDLWMIREIYRRDPENYRARIVTDSEHALLHIDQTDQERQAADWGPPGQLERNRELYFGHKEIGQL